MPQQFVQSLALYEESSVIIDNQTFLKLFQNLKLSFIFNCVFEECLRNFLCACGNVTTLSFIVKIHFWRHAKWRKFAKQAKTQIRTYLNTFIFDKISLSQPIKLFSGIKNECFHEKIHLELLENFLWDTYFYLGNCMSSFKQKFVLVFGFTFRYQCKIPVQTMKDTLTYVHATLNTQLYGLQNFCTSKVYVNH